MLDRIWNVHVTEYALKEGNHTCWAEVGSLRERNCFPFEVDSWQHGLLKGKVDHHPAACGHETEGSINSNSVFFCLWITANPQVDGVDA
jgi:hypothetical protein